MSECVKVGQGRPKCSTLAPANFVCAPCKEERLAVAANEVGGEVLEMGFYSEAEPLENKSEFVDQPEGLGGDAGDVLAGGERSDG